MNSKTEQSKPDTVQTVVIPDDRPIIIVWQGKSFEFASRKDALLRGFHLG